MSLKTDYRDAIPPSTGRVYRPTYNSDNTMTLEDVTEYEQVGDAFGAADINAVNTKVNDIITGLSVQLGVPFLTGGIDKDTNKPIWGFIQDRTFANLAAGFNAAFQIPGVTKFVFPVMFAEKFGTDLVSGPLPIGSNASIVSAQGTVLRSEVELFLWGSAVSTSTSWRFWTYYTL